MHTTDNDARAGARVDACVILAGGLRLSPLTRETGVSGLDLWLGGACASVFDHWLARLAACAAAGAPVIVVHDANSPAPQRGAGDRGLDVRIVRETRDYRGPAGVVRDVSRELPPDARLLIADASRLVTPELSEMLETHDRRGGGTTVIANSDDSPAGMYVTTRKELDLVPERGFMDLKEQWLAKVAVAERPIWVYKLAAPGAMPLRTRAQALDAARALAGVWTPDARRRLWRRPEEPTGGVFAVISPHAEVAPGALVADSVVMSGAKVGAGAAVVRSLVLPGARVESGVQVVDAVVSSKAVVSAG